MNLEILRLSWRSLWRNSRRTLITTASIAFGLGLAVFSEALGTGIYGKMASDAARMQAGDITVQHRDYLESPAVDLYIEDALSLRTALQGVEGVEAVKLLVLGQGIARSSAAAVSAAFIGVDAALEARTSPIAKKIVEGRYLKPSDEGRVVIGHKLAERLNVGVGKKLVLSSNDADGNLVEQLFRVVGIFATRTDMIDAHLVQTRATELADLLQLPAGAATQVGVLLRDPDQLATVLPAIAAQLRGNARAYGWQDIMPGLANYIRADHGALKFINGILIFLVLFTILNTVMMSVLEREREFAILLAIGTPVSRIGVQVAVETLFTGLIGCALGVAIGVAGGYYVQVNGLDLERFYSGIEVEAGGFAVDMVLFARVKMGAVLELALMVLAATMLTAIPGIQRLAHIELTARTH